MTKFKIILTNGNSFITTNLTCYHIRNLKECTMVKNVERLTH